MAELTKFEQWWLSAWPHRWHIRRVVPRFLKSCPEPVRGEVLEIGTGPGWTSQRILETFPQVELTAVDIDPEIISHFETLRHVYGQRLKVRQADVMHLPFDRHSFDMVVAVYVMHHLDDRAQGLQQILRVLRPGGLIGLVDGALLFSGRRNAIRTPELLAMLQAEDCEVLALQEGRTFFLWARKPYPITPGT